MSTVLRDTDDKSYGLVISHDGDAVSLRAFIGDDARDPEQFITVIVSRAALLAALGTEA